MSIFHKHVWSKEDEYYDSSGFEKIEGQGIEMTVPRNFYHSHTTVIYGCKCGKMKIEQYRGRSMKQDQKIEITKELL